MSNAVIVAMGRSAVGKAPKGKLIYTRPDDLAAQIIKGVLAKVPTFDPSEIEDFILGCAFPEAEQGMNMARNVILAAGLSENIPGQTVNRFCASGLQSIASAANEINAGQADIVLAGGVESMSMIPMGGNHLFPNPALMDNNPKAYTVMGLTAENVSQRYHITREEQDEFSAQSHKKAVIAQAEGKFKEEIIPVEAVQTYIDEIGRAGKKSVIFDQDEGIRASTTTESLAKLKTIFKAGGTVTAGNSSQMSDGAAAVLLMSEEKASSQGLQPLAIFRGFAVSGVAPEIMGIGPVSAIPKALKLAGLTLNDVDLFELNEAFASQSIACIKELDLNRDKVNVNGGAIALGHPLGCTGSLLTVKLISELKRRKQRYGVVSMCIGGGMGAAAVFEMVQKG